MGEIAEDPTLTKTIGNYVWGVVAFALILAATATVVLAPIALFKYVFL